MNGRPHGMRSADEVGGSGPLQTIFVGSSVQVR
jgi:hypothetical protein